MVIALILLCQIGFTQQEQSTRQWFSGIAVNGPAAALRQELEGKFQPIRFANQPAEADTCAGCLKFAGTSKKCDLGLAVNPDSAKAEALVLTRVVYENERKKKIDKKNYNGLVREIRFTYYFHEKGDAKNAYKAAVSSFTKNLEKKVGPVDASFDIIETRDGKKIKTRYKGITINHTDLADDLMKDSIYMGSGENDLYMLIIEREMAL